MSNKVFLNDVTTRYLHCFSTKAENWHKLAHDVFGMKEDDFVRELSYGNLDDVFSAHCFLYAILGEELNSTPPEVVKLRCYDILFLRGFFKIGRSSPARRRAVETMALRGDLYGKFFGSFDCAKILLFDSIYDTDVHVMCSFLAFDEDEDFDADDMNDNLPANVHLIWDNNDPSRYWKMADFPLPHLRDIVRAGGGAEVFDKYFSGEMPDDVRELFADIFLKGSAP